MARSIYVCWLTCLLACLLAGQAAYCLTSTHFDAPSAFLVRSKSGQIGGPMRSAPTQPVAPKIIRSTAGLILTVTRERTLGSDSLGCQPDPGEMRRIVRSDRFNVDETRPGLCPLGRKWFVLCQSPTRKDRSSQRGHSPPEGKGKGGLRDALSDSEEQQRARDGEKAQSVLRFTRSVFAGMPCLFLLLLPVR